MKDTYIILIPIEGNHNARRHCEEIENTTMVVGGGKSWVSHDDIKNKLIKSIDDDTCDLDSIEVWDISDFMTWCNDEQFNPDAYFMSYVYVKDWKKSEDIRKRTILD